MAWGPDVIACQGTSSDPGPYYTATSESHLDTMTFAMDMETMLLGAKKAGIPFISSLGGGGSDDHLERCLRVVDDIARKHGRLRIAVISGQPTKEFILRRLAEGAQARRI